MADKSLLGGGVGSNQYQARGSSRRASGNAKLNPSEFYVLDPANDPSFRKRRLQARDPNTSLAELKRYANGPDWRLRAGVAQNISTSPKILIQLASDVKPHVRWKVVCNATAPAPALAILAQRVHDKPLLVAVSGHPNTSAKVLTELMRLDDHEIDSCIARHHNAPSDLLWSLHRISKSNNVRVGLAGNPRTPSDTLAKLVAEDFPPEIKEAVANNYNAAIETLDTLATDPRPDVRYGVACNPNTAPDTLARLGRDTQIDVLGGVARNQHTPLETLIKLTQSEWAAVRQDALSNPSTPPHIKAILALGGNLA